MTEEASEAATESNVVNLAGETLDPVQVAKENERIERCSDVLSTAKDLTPINIVVIGVTSAGNPFVLDSEESVANVSYMTDLTKAMLFRGEIQ